MPDEHDDDEFDDELDDEEDLDEEEEEFDDQAETGELCPSCGEYLLDGLSGDVIECPICGTRVKLT